MSDLIKQHFRASNGFDAAGGKIINVAKADRTVMSDGVNVEYLIQENTIQPWADDRGYIAGFAVHFEKRVWVSRVDIAAPIPPAKNTFKQTEWVSMRVDPKWEEYTLGTNNRLDPGTYANVNTSASPVTLRLPKTGVQDGDTIVVRDVGGLPGVNKALITLSTDTGGSDPLPIIYRGSQVKEVMITRPYSMFLFTYSRTGWYATLTDMSSTARMINSATPDATGTNPKGAQVQSSDNIYRKYTGSKLTVRLPQWASHGDIITFSEPDGQTPLYHFTIKSYDSSASASIGSSGTREMTFKGRGGGQIIYDGPSNTWIVDANDFRQRLQVITADINLQPNGAVSVFGTDNSTQKTITITLPTNISIGDTAFISMEYMRKGQTVVIKASTGDKIATSVGLLQFPRRSEYPPDGAWVMNDQISFNGTSSYPTDIELAYIEDSGTKYWIVVENKPTVERVDAEARDRVGVIALATSSEAQAMSGHQKEKAITPETLASRTATESRTGIAQISNNSQATANSNTTLDDSTIMTPKKVDSRTSTESRRGVAFIATQTDTNTGTDDSKIVTPKKLNDRKASDSLTGILALVKQGGIAATGERADAGTGIYDHGDYSKAVTPKTLREYKATEKASGAVWLATDAEVRNPPDVQTNIPIVVTPQSLHKKTSSTSDIGLIQLATQTEANSMSNPVTNKAITPETLNGRKASDTQTGILRFATATEFSTGTTLTEAANPKRIKDYFSQGSLVSTDPGTSGIFHSGNIWAGISLSIRAPSETQRGTTRIATQNEVIAGTADDTIVTPKKLQGKKASESAYGIMKYATQADTSEGTIKEQAVSPVHLKYVVQQDSSWRAQDTVRGTVRTANDAVAWTGNNVTGSDSVSKESTGYAVSPNGLKQALSNYLPLLGKAADTGKFDNLSSSQFVRRDIDQTVYGALTLEKNTITKGSLTVLNQFNASAGEVRITPAVDDGIDHVRFLNLNGTERGIIYARPNTDSLGEIFVRVKDISDGTGQFVFNSKGELTASSKVISTSIQGNASLITSGIVQVSNIQALKVEGSALIVGAQSNPVFIRAPNENSVFVQDSTGSYSVLNTKNYSSFLNYTYVRKAGDSMSGDLTINSSAVVIIGSESWYNPSSSTAMGKQGSWTTEVKDSAKVNSLPGYVVPIREEIDDPNKPGQKIKVVVGYTEKKGKGGLLAQTGVYRDNTYQVWTPYAPDTETAELSRTHTMWTRIWNPRLGRFDEWMRIYTSATPPTAADIGAPSSVSTQVKTLEVLDWIKIGPVKIYPDRTTQTVKFEWVGD